jgi:hypothetical protein
MPDPQTRCFSPAASSPTPPGEAPFAFKGLLAAGLARLAETVTRFRL